ncbi:threonine/serine exporter family protein [Polymorphobacter sp.]|uniref:threonine/serine exporter family protein n=1 Tax=Polymorphobacter sp. TaxID=1909290 RepID=UPI003F6E4D2D
MMVLIENMAFGAIAAAGFGVLFNFGGRDLLWCAAAGALALATRTLGIDAGLALEAASFMAAAVLGCGVRVLRGVLGPSRNALAVAGCIPMVPGSFAAKAILGMFALSSAADGSMVTAATTMEYLLRVAFTLGAIGTGLSITTQLFGNRDF